MTLPRVVVPEVLDGLAEHDPAAQRARRDLQRVHRVMGTRAILLDGLRALPWPAGTTAAAPPLRVLELGAGDGSLLLGVARALRREWPPVELTLLDRQRLLTPALVDAYAGCGWSVRAQVADALEWADAVLQAAAGARQHWDLIVANLFLHHFEEAELGRLLAAVSVCGRRFLACEPRRGWLALAGSRLIGALGVNAVTREDACLSVRAGFAHDELSALWPADAQDWSLHEYPAGLFSHCLAASRVPPAAWGGQGGSRCAAATTTRSTH